MSSNCQANLSEFEKMRLGLIYSAYDEELLKKRRRALILLDKFNAYIPGDSQKNY